LTHWTASVGLEKVARAGHRERKSTDLLRSIGRPNDACSINCQQEQI
jgi:hypothetical protein